MKAPGKEGRGVCLEHGSEGGVSWKSPGLITWDLVVYSKAVRLQEGILSGGRRDVTHILMNTLAVICRKDRRAVHRMEMGTRRPTGRSLTREVTVAQTEGSGWIWQSGQRTSQKPPLGGIFTTPPPTNSRKDTLVQEIISLRPTNPRSWKFFPESWHHETVPHHLGAKKSTFLLTSATQTKKY